ncbi:TetR family transcriptional regulator [Simiduia agarivorans SA1 = DSM 21679]|uniref:TetR family transcriptional regulator n=2 Tax=Simiduia TaxID=447467 RepID=K4KJ36_SIMAS|nr:TetR family transcriptional regulator [Simiduia agarivorans SA1 = DSM 21679]
MFAPMSKAHTPAATRSYHHGDLRQSLMLEASALLDSEGIAGLSLRKLADRVGVSRTALYHHFTDKNALLCAIAAGGFNLLEELMAPLAQDAGLAPGQRYSRFARRYIDFAIAHPARYSLMFGHTLWHQGLANEDLKQVAFESFKRHREAVARWQSAGILPSGLDSLRLTQVTWGTLHGLAQLVLDGVYADATHLDEICDTVGQLFCG